MDEGGRGARYSGVMYRSAAEEIMLAMVAEDTTDDGVVVEEAPDEDLACVISCPMLDGAGGESDEDELTLGCSSIVIIWSGHSSCSTFKT